MPAAPPPCPAPSGFRGLENRCKERGKQRGLKLGYCRKHLINRKSSRRIYRETLRNLGVSGAMQAKFAGQMLRYNLHRNFTGLYRSGADYCR